MDWQDADELFEPYGISVSHIIKDEQEGPKFLRFDFKDVAYFYIGVALIETCILNIHNHILNRHISPELWIGQNLEEGIKTLTEPNVIPSDRYIETTDQLHVNDIYPNYDGSNTDRFTYEQTQNQMAQVFEPYEFDVQTNILKYFLNRSFQINFWFLNAGDNLFQAKILPDTLFNFETDFFQNITLVRGNGLSNQKLSVKPFLVEEIGDESTDDEFIVTI